MNNQYTIQKVFSKSFVITFPLGNSFLFAFLPSHRRGCVEPLKPREKQKDGRAERHSVQKGFMGCLASHSCCRTACPGLDAFQHRHAFPVLRLRSETNFPQQDQGCRATVLHPVPPIKRKMAPREEHETGAGALGFIAGLQPFSL